MPDSGRYGARRPSQSPNVLPVITVFCDDTTTAVAYFDILKKEVEDKCTVRVIRAPFHGATANDMLECTRQRRPSTREDNDQAWLLLDVDTLANQEIIRSKAEGEDIKAAFSKPCYEIWTLAHLEDTGEAFLNCRAVVARIQQRWKERFEEGFDRKSVADYRKIMPFRANAIARCRSRKEANSQSWTEVWRVVESILS